MDPSQQKAQFSIAYVRAVATVAGFKVFSCDVDDDSIDMGLGQTGGAGTIRSPRLDLQLKCTESDVLRGDGLHIALKRKNYDDLRHTDVMVPRILVGVLVPPSVDDWIVHVPGERISLFRHAWWVSLLGADEKAGIATPTVVLKDFFTVDSLRAIMQTVESGGAL